MLPRILVVTLVVGAILSVAILALALLNRRDQAAGLDEEIQYDDFAFSVLSTRKVDALGSKESRTMAQGVYLVVTLKVANHAKRVGYRFKPSTAIVVDERGNEYRVSSAGQKALEAERGMADPCAAEILAGRACVTDLVFDVPAGARLSHLRISEGGRVGDVLDLVFYGRKTIRLE